MSRATFRYMFVNDAETTMPELVPYHGQEVTILGPVELDHDEFTMSRVRADDGYEFDAFNEELTLL